MKRLLFIYLLK